MSDIFTLTGKSILVTGASSGIGREIALLASQFGANLTLIGRNEQRLKETQSMLTGTSHEIVVADLTKEKDLNQIASGKIFDGVIFNAGIVEYAPIKFINEDKIKKIFDTNFNASVLLCRLLLKNKFVNKNGSLIFISSISSKLGISGTALYASTKAALSAFSKVVASEVASQGIRSNTICPAIVMTPMTAQAQAVTSTQAMEEAAKAYPLGYGTPMDVSATAVFLLSNASRWITGSEIILDGGLTLR
jgi:NAD(P)-dependent dehydrogenase (short-subunit alcohol dehydrogenase family)